MAGGSTGYTRTKGLAHLSALRISDQAVAVYFLERNLACEL